VTVDEVAASAQILRAVPEARDPARLRGIVLGPGEGTVLLRCERDARGAPTLRGFPLIPAAATERRFDVGDSAWALARDDAAFYLPPGTYSFAHAPGESAIRVGLGERFERAGALGGEETEEHAAWYALLGLGGADLLARYDDDFDALHADLQCVAGGTVEVGDGGALRRWAVCNTYVAEPCNCVALAARVPLPLDKLYVPYYDAGDLGALLAREPALRDPHAYAAADAPERTGSASFIAKASTVDRRPYEAKVHLARQCADSRARVREAALHFSANRRAAAGGRGVDGSLLNDLLQAQAAFLSLRQRLRNAGGYGRLRRERGERAALRALGLLDERESRFRGRRRL
jgi:hypothetical protein